jgi:acetyltransferase-like isoleucine patch superfamily enzyme
MEDNQQQHGPGQWNGRAVNGAPRPMTTDRNLPPPPAIMQPYAPGPPNQRSYAPPNPSTGYAPMQMAASALRTVDNNRIQPPISGYGPPPPPPSHHPGPSHHSEQNPVDSMQNGFPFKPTETILVDLRKRADQACMKFNKWHADGASHDECLRLLREVIDCNHQSPDASVNHNHPSERMGSDIKISGPLYAEYGFNLRIGDNVWIKSGVRFEDPREIRIGNNTVIGPNVIISGEMSYSQANWRQWRKGVHIRIGKDVSIGAGAIIAPEDLGQRDYNEIVIGDGAYIAPGAIVSRVSSFHD